MSLTNIEILSQILVFFNISFIAVALYALWRNRRQLFGGTPPELRQAQKKADQIIRRAVEKANQLMVESELDGVEAVAQRRLDSSKLEKAYQQELSALAESLKQQYIDLTANLEKEAHSLRENYTLYLDEVKKLSGQVQKEQEERLERKLDNLVESASENLQNNLQAQTAGLEKTLADYKEARREIIDKQAVALLERTLQLTIGEVMSLEKHKEAVIEALKQAGEEGFFN